MPAAGADTNAAMKRSNPSGKGTCNGTGCDYMFQSLRCKFGTSTKQAGAGDGKKCDVYNFGKGEAYALCPGRS
ncbi:hypothetical protein PG991_000803 [Apiospora marii]|uniref:Uncharacterized protein n=2 Tax=Apiospora marii TaxID=335849 RepID=A0ABR1ST10_9PEZI